MENHHFQWVNPLFLWPFSIAVCMFTRGYPLFIHFPMALPTGQVTSETSDEMPMLSDFLEVGTTWDVHQMFVEDGELANRNGDKMVGYPLVMSK